MTQVQAFSPAFGLISKRVLLRRGGRFNGPTYGYLWDHAAYTVSL